MLVIGLVEQISRDTSQSTDQYGNSRCSSNFFVATLSNIFYHMLTVRIVS